MHQLLNAERTSRGLAPLARMQSVDSVARDWSVSMYQSGKFVHRPDIGAQIPGSWSSVGENIIWWGGYGCDVEADAQRAVSGWMNSPGHRDNILRPGYTHTGLGFHSGSSSTYGSITYGTQNFVTYSTTAAPTATSSLSLSPTSGKAKSIVTVQGKGYPARFQVDILFGPSDVKIGSATTDATGAFSASVTIPAVADGSYTIRARAQNSTSYQQQTFRVQGALATLSLSPTSVDPGGVVSFSGTNFQPGERVDIRWGGAYGDIIGYVTARADGSISGRVTVRATSSGTYTIVARGTASYKAVGAKVTVSGLPPLVTVTPTETAAGTVVRFSGQGFTPGEIVNITWDTYNGPRLGYVRAGSDGKISGSVTVPASAPAGTHYLYARGQSSSITVRRALSITSTQMRTAAVQQTGITLTQSSLAMGQTTTLTGQGFQPGEKVTVSTGWGAELTTVTAGSDGRFTTTITIPNPVPYADQPQVLRATGAASQNRAEAPFRVTDWDRAAISLSPSTGPVGSTTTLVATGYAPGEDVTIHVGASSAPVLAKAKADGSGTVTVEVTIPQNVASGTVDLIVAGADGLLLGKDTFTIGEAVEATPGATSTPVETPESVSEPGATEPPATPAEVPAETEVPTAEPTAVPTQSPTEPPVETPTAEPTAVPTEGPAEVPVVEPTPEPTDAPAEEPPAAPTEDPVGVPTDDEAEPAA